MNSTLSHGALRALALAGALLVALPAQAGIAVGFDGGNGYRDRNTGFAASTYPFQLERHHRGGYLHGRKRHRLAHPRAPVRHHDHRVPGAGHDHGLRRAPRHGSRVHRHPGKRVPHLRH